MTKKITKPSQTTPKHNATKPTSTLKEPCMEGEGTHEVTTTRKKIKKIQRDINAIYNKKRTTPKNNQHTTNQTTMLNSELRRLTYQKTQLTNELKKALEQSKIKTTQQQTMTAKEEAKSLRAPTGGDTSGSCTYRGADNRASTR